jgi:hypothetical protein
MAVRITLRALSLIVVTLMLGYVWLAASFDRGNSWTLLLPLAALGAFWAYWILAWWPKQLVALRWSLLTVAVLTALPFLVQYLVVQPVTMKQQRIAGNIRAHETALTKALAQYNCPDGRVLVIVPWVTLRDVGGDRRLVELLLIEEDPTTRPRFLARTTAHSGLHLDSILEERWQELEACFGDSDGLRDLLRRMEDGAFEAMATEPNLPAP